MADLHTNLRRFLEHVGVSPDETPRRLIQQLRTLEQDLDVDLMHLLEQEWLDEQMQEDLRAGDFDKLQDVLDQATNRYRSTNS